MTLPFRFPPLQLTITTTPSSSATQAPPASEPAQTSSFSPTTPRKRDSLKRILSYPGIQDFMSTLSAKGKAVKEEPELDSREIRDHERLPEIETYVSHHLTQIEQETCLAVAKFLFLDKEDQAKARGFLNLISMQNGIRAKNLQNSQDYAYKHRLLPKMDEFQQEKQAVLDNLPRDVASRDTTYKQQVFPQIDEFLQPRQAAFNSLVAEVQQERGSGIKESARKLKQLLESKNKRQGEIGALITNAFDQIDQIAQKQDEFITEAIGLVKSRQQTEFDKSSKSNLTREGVALLTAAYGDHPPAGSLCDFVEAFAPDAVKQRKQEVAEQPPKTPQTSAPPSRLRSSSLSPSSAYLSSPFSDAEPPSPQSLGFPSGPKRSLSVARSIRSARSFSSTHNAADRAMYERTEDAFTVEPVSQRGLEPGEEIRQIEDGMQRATEKLAAIRQLLSAADADFPKIPAVSDQLRENLDQADSRLAQTRIRIYNRLQKPREEGVLDAAALDEIGNCFAQHVEQSHIPGIEQAMAKICSDFLSAHYRDKAFSQKDPAYRFVQAVCPEAAQSFRNEPRRTTSQRHGSTMAPLPE